jgi:hypothetical protein
MSHVPTLVALSLLGAMLLGRLVETGVTLWLLR